MGLALLFILFKGSGSEGQKSIFDTFLVHYIEETAAITTDISQSQLADINSVFAYSTPANRIPKPSVINTIQDNSIVARGTILTDLLDEFSDRGDQITEYEVQEGDTLSFVASDYGVSLNTIIWANNLKSVDDIKPGAKLKIPPVSGIIHKVKSGDTVEIIAKKYGVNADRIISFNSLPKDGTLIPDDEIIVPDGKIQTENRPTAIAKNSKSTAKKRFAYLPDFGGFFSWPSLGFNWGRIHGRNGVDLANACGTPIYASAAGTVAIAKGSGWNGGFGKFIKLIHSNGTETIYAHASKVLVTAGQSVGKNEQIALMGTTGRSTGCHVHFEVHGAKNPLAKY